MLAGLELGVEGQYNFGTFTPKYYSDGGFVPQPAPADVAAQLGIPVGAPGFAGRAPGTWVRLDRRELEEVRVKAFMKARF